MQNAEMAHDPRASVAPPPTGRRPDRQPAAQSSETPDKKQRSMRSKGAKKPTPVSSPKKSRFLWINAPIFKGFTLREMFFMTLMIIPIMHLLGIVFANHDIYLHFYAWAYQQVTGVFPNLSGVNVYLTGWTLIIFDVFALTLLWFVAFKEHAKIVAVLLCSYVFVTYGGAL